ncbi:MAG: DUF3810 domain-containing protein [Clostridiaceae bacterium]|jgi:hypothetical protein|nr:DUF3810 domain-containing protein [Clostridiaceae bacterium]
MTDRQKDLHENKKGKRRLAPFIFLAVSGLLLIILLLFRALAFKDPKLADGFARHVFQPLARIWTWPVSLIPFSLTELLAVLLTLALPILLIWGIVRLIRIKEGRGRRCLRTMSLVMALACLLLSLFLLFHGINYARSPLAASMSLEVRDRSLDELESAFRRMGLQASRTRHELEEDDQGLLASLSMTWVRQSALGGWDQAGDRWPALYSKIRPRPKGVLLSPYWSHTRIVGLYMPLLVEANVNTDQPFFMVPVSAAHELAHARGFAREDDCDFAAILSCLVHPDPLWRYSGQISAWKSLGRRLYQEDADLWAEAYSQSLSPGVIRDLQAESAYWKAFETPLADLSEKINDSYLKANREPEGVKSYGGVVDLLLAWMDEPESGELIPPARP